MTNTKNTPKKLTVCNICDRDLTEAHVTATYGDENTTYTEMVCPHCTSKKTTMESK